MARKPRIDLAGIAQHLIQRGNNRQACFFTDDDRRHYLKWLGQAAEKYGGSLHAYVLMTNHAHLLATGAEAGALGRMMQSLGRRYVRYVNSRYQRTGTLWEGRFRSSLIESDQYLLTCYRYIELNPVRSNIVAKPGEYRWSSFDHNAGGKTDDLITPHPTYLSLGKTEAARLLVYRQLFRDAIDSQDIKRIRDHVNQGKVLGSEAFRNRVEATLNCRARLSTPGRPRRKKYPDPVSPVRCVESALFKAGEDIVSKEQKSNKETKKVPAMTAKEKKAAKKAKKNERGRIGE
jgi:putative transposase